MTVPGRKRPDPNFYYGVIEHATRLGLSTQEVWGLIRDQAEAAGLSSPGINAAQVSQLRGSAAGTRTADRNLSRADAPYGLGAEMISTARWARPPAQRDALPMWQVRFQHTTTQAGQERTDWRTVMFTGSLPPTKGDLLARVQRDAEQMSRNYELAHVGIGDLSILAV